MMIISDNQIMHLLDIAQEYAIKLYELDRSKDYSRDIATLVRKIKDQQSEELRESAFDIKT